jgi:hypothetical protein
VGTFDAMERHAAAAKVMLARKVDESGAWKRAGFRNVAEFLAARSGCSMGAARTQVDMSKKLRQLPSTAETLRDGRLSREQAAAVVDGAAANPKAEPRLLALAERASLKELRDEALRTRASADPDPDTTHRRIHAQRRLRTWTDGEGAWNMATRGTTAEGSLIEAALKPVIERIFKQARAEGRRGAPRLRLRCPCATRDCRQ